MSEINTNQPGLAEGLLAELDSLEGQNLTAEETKEYLDRIIATRLQPLAEAGFNVCFDPPVEIAGEMVGDLRLYLLSLKARLDYYEAPIETIEEEVVFEDDAPEWLLGNENLVWKGAADNPLWEVEPHSYENTIKVSYRRRGQVLRPGRSKTEQTKELKDVKHVFEREEWLIIEDVLKEYNKLQRQSEGPEQISKEAADKLRAVLREENLWRRAAKTGREAEEPKIIKEQIVKNIKQLAKAKRWSKDKISKYEEKADELSQAAAEILSQLFILNRHRGDGREHIPKLDKHIKEIPSFEIALKALMNCFEYQLKIGTDEKPKGMTLLLGEPGVGKNEMVKYAAASLNRPFFWFPCGRGMEAMDLVHHYEFDTKEGTKRFLTALAEGLQTPGAVVMIDEVNALKPQVQAILHGLGDGSRMLNYDGVSIPVSEGVIIVIAGNPATQASAGNLSEALLNRTRGQSMVMEYPALLNGELEQRRHGWSQTELEAKEVNDNALREYACDEVLAIFPSFNEFQDLSDSEFKLLWDDVVNQKPAFGSRKVVNLLNDNNSEHIKKTLIDLRNMLMVIDKWRKEFVQHTSEIAIGVSLRDTMALVTNYKRLRDVRKTFSKVFDDFRKNPIEGLDANYERMQQIINDVLGGQ